MTPLNTHPEMRWIPVGERLPDEGEIVIASLETSFDTKTKALRYASRYIGKQCVGQYFCDMLLDTEIYTIGHRGCRHHVYVTAWMPLPAPYDEKSEAIRALNANRTEAGDRRDWNECDRLETDLKRLGLKDS